MDALSRRQHAAEEAWAKEAQEFAASAYRAKLQSSKAGSERLARALPPPAPAASMLPAIAAHALRLGVREEVRAAAAAPQSRSVALAVQWQAAARRRAALYTLRRLADARAARAGATPRDPAGERVPLRQPRAAGCARARRAHAALRAS